jgi:hypothetical protein
MCARVRMVKDNDAVGTILQGELVHTNMIGWPVEHDLDAVQLLPPTKRSKIVCGLELRSICRGNEFRNP